MKRLTLDKTWKLCMAVWDFIDENPNKDVDRLKAQWLQEHDFEDVLCDCFFCEYDIQRRTASKHLPSDCHFCPGVKIDKDFNCHNIEYRYYDKASLFYKKLASMNKIRLKTKKIRSQNE